MVTLKSTYPIGIDIGSQNIYATQLKKTRQGFEVRGLVHQKLEGEAEEIPDDADILVPLLRQISKNKQFSGKRVIVHFDSQNIFSFPITFQVSATETLEEAIFRESKEYIPFPIEEAIIDYPSILTPSPDGPNQHKATIIAVRREYIDQHLSLLKQAGLVVEAVDFGVSSLIRLHHHLYDLSENPIILCNIGHTQSLLSILTKESILAQQNVSWGIQALLKRILANIELFDDPDKAKILLKKYGLHYDARGSAGAEKDHTDETEDHMLRTVYQIITPYIEEFIYELHKIIGYARSENQNVFFEGIYMYGLATLIYKLDHYIESRLNVSTTLINPMSKVALSDFSILPDISEGAPFALALGLAMRKVPWL